MPCKSRARRRELAQQARDHDRVKATERASASKQDAKMPGVGGTKASGMTRLANGVEVPTRWLMEPQLHLRELQAALQGEGPEVKKNTEDDQQMRSVNGVEIFAVGCHREGEECFSLDDLEEMVENFHRLSNPKNPTRLLTPTVAVGHSDNQEWLKDTGYPAAGIVSALRLDGNKVIADFSDVPPAVADAIDARRYIKVSPEVYTDLYIDGKHYGMALRRVAILGSEIPQVKGLKDLPMSTYTDSHARLVRLTHLPHRALAAKALRRFAERQHILYRAVARLAVPQLVRAFCDCQRPKKFTSTSQIMNLSKKARQFIERRRVAKQFCERIAADPQIAAIHSHYRHFSEFYGKLGTTKAKILRSFSIARKSDPRLTARQFLDGTRRPA